MAKVVELIGANFEKEVTNTKGIVMVDFWAEWCGPCKMLGPVLEELADSKSELKILKVNVDEENELSAKFKVRSIPTVVIFKDGVQVSNFIGFKSKEEILEKLSSI